MHYAELLYGGSVFCLEIEKMKNYTKQKAIRIITDAAAKYNEHLCGRKFLVVYEGEKGPESAVIAFYEQHFKHLTGAVTNLSAKVFYSRALDHKLSPNDFSFDSSGNMQRKLAVLPVLHRLLYNGAMRGSFNRSGIRIEADYFIGETAHCMAVAFRSGKSCDIPVSLYCEDVRRLTNNCTRILAVWRTDKGSANFTENTYCANGVDVPALSAAYL